MPKYQLQGSLLLEALKRRDDRQQSVTPSTALKARLKVFQGQFLKLRASPENFRIKNPACSLAGLIVGSRSLDYKVCCFCDSPLGHRCPGSLGPVVSAIKTGKAAVLRPQRLSPALARETPAPCLFGNSGGLSGLSAASDPGQRHLA